MNSTKPKMDLNSGLAYLVQTFRGPPKSGIGRVDKSYKDSDLRAKSGRDQSDSPLLEENSANTFEDWSSQTTSRSSYQEWDSTWDKKQEGKSSVIAPEKATKEFRKTKKKEANEDLLIDFQESKKEVITPIVSSEEEDLWKSLNS